MFTAREKQAHAQFLLNPEGVKATINNIPAIIINTLPIGDKNLVLRMKEDPEFFLSVLTDEAHPFTINLVKSSLMHEQAAEMGFTLEQRKTYREILKILSDPQEVNDLLRELEDQVHTFPEEDKNLVLRMIAEPEFFKSVLNNENHPFTIKFVVKATSIESFAVQEYEHRNLSFVSSTNLDGPAVAFAQAPVIPDPHTQANSPRIKHNQSAVIRAEKRSSSPLKFFDQRQNDTAETLAQSLEGTQPSQDQTVSAQENRFVLVNPPR